MAIYCYTTLDGKRIEKQYPIGTAPRTTRINVGPRRITAYLDLAAMHGREHRYRNVQARWPIHSDAAAVHPCQIQEAMDFDRRHGVETHYLPDGRPEFRSPGHRRRYLKAHRMFDRSGYD